jgi:hypothetical protein
MAMQDKMLPEMMTAPETGETLARGVRPFVVTYKGESVTVDLPGYYPKGAASTRPCVRSKRSSRACPRRRQSGGSAPN